VNLPLQLVANLPQKLLPPFDVGVGFDAPTLHAIDDAQNPTALLRLGHDVGNTSQITPHADTPIPFALCSLGKTINARSTLPTTYLRLASANCIRTRRASAKRVSLP